MSIPDPAFDRPAPIGSPAVEIAPPTADAGTQVADTIKKAADAVTAIGKATTTVSRSAVSSLFDEFTPKATPAPTPAEKERAKRLGQLDAQVQRLALDLKNLGILDAKDLAAAERAGRALLTVAKTAAVAIGSIPDGKLVESEPKTRAARSPRPGPEPKVEEAVSEAAAVLEQSGVAEEDVPAAAESAVNVARSGPRSGPKPAEREPEDPNLGDGF
jgi:hypothetical protein